MSDALPSELPDILTIKICIETPVGHQHTSPSLSDLVAERLKHVEELRRFRRRLSRLNVHDA